MGSAWRIANVFGTCSPTTMCSDENSRNPTRKATVCKSGVAQARGPEQRLQERGHGRLAHPAQAERGHGDAELTGGKIGLEVVEHAQRQARGGAPLLGPAFHAEAADAHQSELGGDEERVRRQQQDHGDGVERPPRSWPSSLPRAARPPTGRRPRRSAGEGNGRSGGTIMILARGLPHADQAAASNRASSCAGSTSTPANARPMPRVRTKCGRPALAFLSCAIAPSRASAAKPAERIAPSVVGRPTAPRCARTRSASSAGHRPESHRKVERQHQAQSDGFAVQQRVAIAARRSPGHARRYDPD